MAVRKICKQKGCRASPRCEHPWWFDVMHEGKRWRMRVDDFALARGATEPIAVKQTAEKVWEPKFLAEIMSGRDPHVPPNVPKVAVGLTVADLLDLYYTNYVEAEGLRDPVTIKGRLQAIKEEFGDLPVSALEKPSEILRFKAAYRKGREVATVNRALSTLRAAINWGRFQDCLQAASPPDLLKVKPPLRIRPPSRRRTSRGTVGSGRERISRGLASGRAHLRTGGVRSTALGLVGSSSCSCS